MFGVDPMVLAQMRASAEAMMTDTCKIEKITNARGEAGERINNDWSLISDEVPCRMITEPARNRGEMMAVAEQASFPERYRVALPHDTSIAAQYRLTLYSDSSTWLVENLQTSQTDQVSLMAIVVPENP